MMPLPTPPGILAASIFLLLLGAVLVWMLRAPRLVAAEVELARRGVDTLTRILVPTSGTAHSERGVELACRLGADQGATIMLAYVIEVPRALPLAASMTGLETTAQAALDRSEQIVRTHGLVPERVLTRARIAGEEIVRLASDLRADLIVMGIRSRLGLREEILGRTSDIVLQRATCEVLLDKLPDPSRFAPASGGAR